jgi:Chemoreceptor zinc-binding domain
VNTNEALSAIRKAKSAHIKWRAFAQALIAGVPITPEKIPRQHTDCDFGKWYYGEGHKSLGQLDSFRGIEVPHEMLHEIYARIFNILNGMEGETLVSRLLATQTVRLRRRTEMAQSLMIELIAVSETLLRAIEILENEVQSGDAPPE